MRGSLERRGQRSWRLKWDLGVDPATGKRVIKRKTARGTKREAEAELARILGAIQGGTYTDPTRITVGELVTKWRDEVAAHEVSAKTFERYAEHADRIISALGRIPLTRLQPLQILEFYGDLRRNGHKRNGGGLSEQTLLHIHKVLTAALTQAVRWRLIAVNPAADVKPPRPARVEMKTLTADEMKRLLTAAESSSLYTLTLLALTTGLRRGELLGLQWRDVDWARRRISVVRTLEETKQGLALKAPKTSRSARMVPVPEVALDALRRQQVRLKADRLRAGSAYQDGDLVLADSVGLPLAPDAVSKAFIALATRAGLKDVSLHSLRHTHVTELLRSGVNPKVVSERVGHSSVAFTLQRYGHALPDMQQDAADHMQRLVGGLLSQ